ncbi:clasp N terminal-domain-containing protein [Neurospora tetraspora]|uniref:Clasp N terminal-domain-containing protein n=1 Tax=Neurospora tetraspora TaxID=94610 RepID=A0AAE0J951_9PEZI|nr:clasp N terminal-domain-containing protein [Neurospora tetraspora]
MAERITDEQVADLLAILRTDASVDAKANRITIVKASIKQHNVPSSCFAPLFEALHIASTAQHPVLVNAGFTTLNHLLARLARQDPRFLAKEAPHTLPVIVDKLGDQKDKFRQLAIQALATLYKVAPVDVERSVRNIAMVGKNPRAKEMSMHWLLQTHQEQGLQFRGYVPTLMELLEDADGSVRDVAKTTVIELFKNAPNAAKSDLKRQLKNFKVRPAIEQAIVKELNNPSSSVSSQQNDMMDLDEPVVSTRAPAPAIIRTNLSASVPALSSERPLTPGLDSRPEPVEPQFVNTQRELDDIFRDMHMFFDGRETEQNWLKREESMTKLRRLIAGNAVSDFHDSFLAALRALLDGIIKAVTSLRTSLSKEGCALVQDIATVYGPGMDPMVEILMQTFVKLCAATKKIASAQANATINTILGKVSYTNRLMQHIWMACQDKNVQPRLYATEWLKTMLTKMAHHKNHVEHTGGLDLIEKCLKKGLADANPGVREKMRATYWTFSGIWPARATSIMNELDSTAQKLLQKDPNNPNAHSRTEAGGARPGMGLSKSVMGAPKPSVRDAIIAQKRAMASSKNQPPRPGSAMAHFSPVGTTRNVSSTSQASTASATTTSAVPAPTKSAFGTSSGGLSGAPMRPGKRRPEVAARPATVGPYSVRNEVPPAEPTSPPPKPRVKTVTSPKTQTLVISPKKAIPRPQQGHSTHSSESGIPIPVSGIPSPTKPTSAIGVRSPRSPLAPELPPSPVIASPSRVMLDPAQIPLPESSPSKDEELSLVVPSTVLPTQKTPSPTVESQQPQIAIVPIEAVEIVPDSPFGSVQVYEDPFTAGEAEPQSTYTGPVLEPKPVNEGAATPQPPQQSFDGENGHGMGEIPIPSSPERTRQNSRLLDSGISKVKTKSLDVHGFRKLQGIIRDPKGGAIFTDDKFDALLSGLFEFLEARPSEIPHIPAEKQQDVKAQILATIKLLLKKMRDNFRPHVSRGLESLLRARAAYDSRSHIVSGMELLADELITLGDPAEITLVLANTLREALLDKDQQHNTAAAGGPGARSLSMGMHVLKEVVESSATSSTPFTPTEQELDTLAGLAAKCLESADSAVRMDAVQLCVALHARVGDQRFWDAVKREGVRDDPKSLITYYIVRRHREVGANA